MEEDSPHGLKPTHAMLTLYAKNLAGDILPLPFSSSPHEDDICRAICPDDPSSVRIISRSKPMTESHGGMDDAMLHNMMDELHDMAMEENEDEDEDEDSDGGEEKEDWYWEDGDRLEYWIEEQELTIHLAPPMGGPYYAITDPEEMWPMYPFTLWVEREEETNGMGKEKRVVYCWTFLFSLREGQYRGPSDYAMDVEGGGGDVYLALRSGSIGQLSLKEAIEADHDIPARYRERMIRAVYRKWVRMLRNRGRRTREERDVQAMHTTEWTRGEKALFQAHYQALRTSTRLMLLHDD